MFIPSMLVRGAVLASLLSTAPRAGHPGADLAPRTARVVAADTAVFAGGCFWGIEAVFEHLKGVTSVVSGYAGGTTKNPSYDDVSSGATGHAESVRVIYDPAQVTYQQLLQVFFTVAHDPTQRNRQGPDVGTQYRSAIFFRTADQQRAAQGYIADLAANKVFPRAIVTEVAPLRTFFPAESYHQDYMVHHPDQPYIVINDAPKVVHLKERFPTLYRDSAAH